MAKKCTNIFVNLFMYALCFHLTKPAFEALTKANPSTNTWGINFAISHLQLLGMLLLGWIFDAACPGTALLVSQGGCLLVYLCALLTTTFSPFFWLEARFFQALQHVFIFGKAYSVWTPEEGTTHKEKLVGVATASCCYVSGMALAKALEKHTPGFVGDQNMLFGTAAVLTLMAIGHTVFGGGCPWMKGRQVSKPSKKAASKKEECAVGSSCCRCCSVAPYCPMFDKYFVPIAMYLIMITANKWVTSQVDKVPITNAPWADCPISFCYLTSAMVSGFVLLCSFFPSLWDAVWRCKCCASAKDCLSHTFFVAFVLVAFKCCIPAANWAAITYKVVAGLTSAWIYLYAYVYLVESVENSSEIGRVAALSAVVLSITENHVSPVILSTSASILSCIIPGVGMCCATKTITLGAVGFVLWFLCDGAGCASCPFVGKFCGLFGCCCKGGKQQPASEEGTEVKRKKTK